MPRTKKQDNLMMIAAYYRELYSVEISNSIDPEKKKVLLQTIDEVNILLKMSRDKLHAVEYHGNEHTGGFRSLYQDLDKKLEVLAETKKIVTMQKPTFEVDEYVKALTE